MLPDIQEQTGASAVPKVNSEQGGNCYPLCSTSVRLGLESAVSHRSRTQLQMEAEIYNVYRSGIAEVGISSNFVLLA